MFPFEEPTTNDNNATHPLTEADALPRILSDEPGRMIRYVELAATYDQDMTWHSAIKRLEAAFDGLRISLYQLHSEEAPIKLTIDQEALDALVVAYLTYLVEKDMPLHSHLTETLLYQAFFRYARACHEENRFETALRAALGDDEDEEEREYARLVAFWLTGAINEYRQYQLTPIDWQHDGLDAPIIVNGVEIGDLLTVYTRFREDAFLGWLKDAVEQDASGNDMNGQGHVR
jgi:hypothetical protein